MEESMKNKGWLIFFIIGIVFIINAIFGRYIVLPGYLSTLEEGRNTLEAAGQTVPIWKIIRYLLWAYSFKLGIFFIGIGALLKISISPARMWVFIGGGFVYIMLAYVPFPGYYPLFFGIGGGLITIFLIAIFLLWAANREQLEESEKKYTDFRLIGYFFFAMASYNLCPLMGVKAFGLYPEKMIRFGLQTEAVSFASRIMLELVLGWLSIFLSYWKRRIIGLPNT